eukprot:10817564-Alexandrium_andersonii.AAC.1
MSESRHVILLTPARAAIHSVVRCKGTSEKAQRRISRALKACCRSPTLRRARARSCMPPRATE